MFDTDFSFYFFFLNIESIRCVTTNPPKILIPAKTTPQKPNHFARGE
jgi:hypothetical protein